jgi:hypothetical protein
MNIAQRLRLSRGGFPLVTVALAAVALTGMLVSSASAVEPTYRNGFEIDTAGWFDASGTITRQPSGYVNPGGYASDINSATGGFHARLDRGTCETQPGGAGDTVNCPGPFTRWGGRNNTWPVGGYTTQVDIYLDPAYARANPDSYGGNITCLEASDPSSDPTCKGTRFDYSSAINNAAGDFLRDFGFNVATGPDPTGNVPCTGWIATAGTNVNRTGASPYNPAFTPQCISNPGWYTFKHTFYAEGNNLKVRMEIIPVGSATATATWTVTSGDLIVTGDPSTSVGCNRYGWFTNQEIFGLPIDNASMTGCGTPLPVPPVDVDVPPVIVLPPPGTGPAKPRPGGPLAQEAADQIITKMQQNQLRSCVVEVRSLGTKRILVARGVARAPAKGAGRLIIRLSIKPKGTKLLTRNFGGVIVKVRALCRSTSGATRAGVKTVRAVLWIEHALTPPGSWVPDQPILTDTGLRFIQKLRRHMLFARAIRCDGYTATWPPSPAHPPALSLDRAKRVCRDLKGVPGGAKARVRLVPHGLTNPIATNSTEAGRRVNRRVFVTIVHFRVIRG